MRKQQGQIIRLNDRWYVRYWERRNIGGIIERKRVTHFIGQAITRSKRPPADISDEVRRYMATIYSEQVPAERILTIVDFVESVYLPWIKRHQRPSTLKGYQQVWRQHLRPLCEKVWLKNVRTYDVQGWLNAIANRNSLSRNSLKRIQSTLSGVFSLAKQLGHYQGVNPVQDTRVDPTAAEPAKTHAYTLEEVQSLLEVLPEPAATAFAVAALMGLRIGEIEALQWEDYHDGEMHISHSIWNGRICTPKTRKSAAPVPVISQLAERLESHRLRSGNRRTGSIFANSLLRPLSMNNLLKRFILPTLNRCARCGRSVGRLHLNTDHDFVRDSRLPEWHGWHSARRGLGSNLYRLGVPPLVIQRILRHSNVSTTQSYYILPSGDDVRKGMAEFSAEWAKRMPLTQTGELPDTYGTVEPAPGVLPGSIN